MIAAGCLGELFAQIADKNIDDLQLRRVHPVVEVIKKHLLGRNGALVDAEQLEDTVFRAGQPHWFVMNRDNAGFEIDDKVPSSDCRLSIVDCERTRVSRGQQIPRRRQEVDASFGVCTLILRSFDMVGALPNVLRIRAKKLIK